ncbi:MAG TPA: DUF1595 domain-containing protein, partial [Polyangiaceae bacterium]|nr:DUF1595 domain-containing protein [Polyangiaceae bacterium]
MTWKQRLGSGSVLLAALCVACVGQIDEPTERAGSGPGTTGGPGSSGTTDRPAVCAEGVCVQGSALARLTRAQYANSVRQLLGSAVVLDVTHLPQDHAAAEIFSSNESVSASADDVDRYSAIAEDLAAAADLKALLACDVTSGDKACAEQLVRDLGEKAYRRPVSPEEVTAYAELYDGVRGEGDSFEDATRLIIATMLQSPSFLYLVEQGGSDAPRQLD